jgi:hypothetical protein
VFNTFSKGEWGKEERKSNPYKKGDDIDIRIRAHDSKYTIFADQKEIKEFEHRVPLNNVTHFSIDGDVFVTHIHWGGKYYVSEKQISTRIFSLKTTFSCLASAIRSVLFPVFYCSQFSQ